MILVLSFNALFLISNTRSLHFLCLLKVNYLYLSLRTWKNSEISVFETLEWLFIILILLTEAVLPRKQRCSADWVHTWNCFSTQTCKFPHQSSLLVFFHTLLATFISCLYKSYEKREPHGENASTRQGCR